MRGLFQWAQLEAIYGWSGGKMSLYIRYADRMRLARDAMHKLSINETKNIYSRTINPGAGARRKKP
jgi:hypothetical protein